MHFLGWHAYNKTRLYRQREEKAKMTKQPPKSVPPGKQSTANAPQGRAKKAGGAIPQGPGHSNIEAIIATRMAASAYAGYFKKSTQISRIMLSVALILSLGMNVFQAVRPTKVVYLYADASGRVMVLYEMDRPNLSDSQVATWAATAISSALTLNYEEYKNQLQASQQEFFTEAGYKSFVKMLTDNRLLQIITDRNLLLTTTVTAAPVLESSGVINGTYAWNYRIPLRLAFHGVQFSNGGAGAGSRTTESRSMIAHVIITRVSEINSKKGIGISRIVLSLSE